LHGKVQLDTWLSTQSQQLHVATKSGFPRHQIIEESISYKTLKKFFVLA